MLFNDLIRHSFNYFGTNSLGNKSGSQFFMQQKSSQTADENKAAVACENSE